MVPVDGSGSSKRACDYALELSDKLKARIAFVFVVEIPRSVRGIRVPSDILDAYDEEGRKVLADCENRSKARGVPCEAIIAHDEPAFKILQVAEKENCDCIVIGRRGLGRFQRFLLGSVSDKVSKLAKVPVIIVK